MRSSTRTRAAMTETRRRRRLPGPLPVVLATVATFLIVFALLAVQLRAGHDPALGSAGQVVALTRGGNHVVTRTSGASAPAVQQHSGKVHPVTTRTSGGRRRAGDDDE